MAREPAADDHWVRSGRELQRIVGYIEENPVSAGLAATAEDWPFKRHNGKLKQPHRSIALQ
jgi:hypothetical protein